jgi:tRNA(fMet)-specific endonuclease VapC
MIVLDSDHLSILQRSESPKYERLLRALDDSADAVVTTTVISLEEQTRGWLAAINRARDVQDQPKYYLRLSQLVDFYGQWQVLPFHAAAAHQFAELRSSGIRIGTMDLKIASIVMTHGAVLLSSNSRDFGRVPGLRHENWLD